MLNQDGVCYRKKHFHFVHSVAFLHQDSFFGARYNLTVIFQILPKGKNNMCYRKQMFLFTFCFCFSYFVSINGISKQFCIIPFFGQGKTIKYLKKKELLKNKQLGQPLFVFVWNFFFGRLRIFSEKVKAQRTQKKNYLVETLNLLCVGAPFPLCRISH